ncbi:nitrate reductase NapE component [Scopulibacillus daqui]|uniref:Nitrate reductase NapE component n=1 Tax=Scopulibacillus daqui TaxID=1469162 RepID=A0ABS2Q2U7_9BACL|nr:nitrate reductase NapE component [Scopulibacillus daqui]
MNDICMIGLLAVGFGVFFGFIQWCDRIVGGGEE